MRLRLRINRSSHSVWTAPARWAVKVFYSRIRNIEHITHGAVMRWIEVGWVEGVVPTCCSRRGRGARARVCARRRCARGRRPPRAPPSCPGSPPPARRTPGLCLCSLSPKSPWSGCCAPALSVIYVIGLMLFTVSECFYIPKLTNVITLGVVRKIDPTNNFLSLLLLTFST